MSDYQVCILGGALVLAAIIVCGGLEYLGDKIKSGLTAAPEKERGDFQ